MRQNNAILRGLGSFFGLLAIGIGLPVALVVLIGWPLPTSLPSLGELSDYLTQIGIPDEFLLNLIAVALWVLWVAFMVSVIVEVSALLCGVVARRVIGGPVQVLAASMVAAIVLAIPNTKAAPVASVPDLASAIVFNDQPVLASATAQAALTTAPEVLPTYEVKHRDTLWDIAEQCLGDPQRWRDIYKLNENKTQGDGRVFANPDRVHPGWVLELPTDAVVESAPKVDPAPVVPVVPETPAEPMPEPVLDDAPVQQDEETPSEDAQTPAAVDEIGNGTEGGEKNHVIDLASGGVLGLTLASGLGAAVVMARLRRRRAYVPTEPEPRQVLAEALVWPTEANTLADVPNVEPTPAAAIPSMTFPPGQVAIGATATGEVPIDVTAAGGISVSGERSSDVMRSLIVGFISNVEPTEAEVVLCGPLAVALFGDVEPFPGLRIESDLAAVLREAEVDLATRGRLLVEGDYADIAEFRRAIPTETVVSRLIVADPTDDRLVSWTAAAADAGRRVGIGLLYVGNQQGRTTIDVDSSGVLVHGPQIGSADRVFALSQREATDALSTLRNGRVDAVESVQRHTEMVEVADVSKSHEQPVSLSVFGPVRFVVGGVELTKGIRAKSYELAALLAVYPKGASGESISASLWPDSNALRSKQNFQTALSSLRSALRAATGRQDNDFVQPNSSNFGVGKDDPGDAGVIGPAGLAQDVVGNDAPLVLGNMGEGHDSGHIADRPSAVGNGAPVVDHNALLAWLHPDALKANVGHSRTTTGAQDNNVCSEFASVVETDKRFGTVFARTLGPGIQHNGDAFFFEVLLCQFANSWVFTVKQAISRLHDRDFRTETAKKLAEFDTNGATANHDNATGNFGQGGGFTVSPCADLVNTVDRRDHGVGSCGDDDVVGLDALPVYFHTPEPQQSPCTLEDSGPLVGVTLHLVAVIELTDHGVAVLSQFGPVELWLTHTRGSAACGLCFGRTEEHLGRDARPIATFTSNEFAFYDGNFAARCKQSTRRHFASRAHSHDNGVEPIRHLFPHLFLV
jgi:hypothetical protein